VTRVGIAITVGTVLVLIVSFLRARTRPLPFYGWVGMILLAGAESLMFRGVWPIDVYFTPIAWTAYLLIVDAMVFSIRGRSRLRDSPLRFFLCGLVSIPLWLIFEAYNLRLGNWTYVGVPVNWAGALFGYGWSFATITPAILETADLIESLGWFNPERPLQFSDASKNLMIAFGALCLVLPVALPVHIGAYFFGLVWIGFVFLLDPINERLGAPSLLRDLAHGRRDRCFSLFVSGWVCGWLWEFWNFWAAAKWHYIFPILQRYKIFEMPIAGYLGFLPFALECFVMFSTAACFLNPDRNAKNKRPHEPTVHATWRQEP
jgi:hypothetical protein